MWLFYKIAIWQHPHYRPTFLSQCENAIKWSNQFVRQQLENVMFAGEENAQETAKKIVKKLSSYERNKTHNRHINFEECKEIGLKVGLIEQDNKFQDLVLTVHHCFMHTLMNTRSFKIIENHLGAALVKQGVISKAPIPQ